MPILGNDLEQTNLANNHYGYSHTRLDTLGATEYTLVTISIDVSGSVSGFEDELEKGLKTSIRALKFDPRADYMLVRVVQFNTNMTEIHGFKLLSACNESDYDGVLKVGGITTLYDTTVNIIDATTDYGNKLYAQDYTVNGIIIVVSDGGDYGSKLGPKAVKDSLKKATTNEANGLESLRTMLVGVNVQDSSVAQYLSDFMKDVGFDQYEKITDATPSSMAKLFGFISKSISAQSQSLGTGGPSQSLTF